MVNWASRGAVLADEAANNVDIVKRYTTSALDVLEPLAPLDLPGLFILSFQLEHRL